MTPLMWAAWKGHGAAVSWFIAASAKLDRQEKWGRTALVLAADEGHVDVVRIVRVLLLGFRATLLRARPTAQLSMTHRSSSLDAPGPVASASGGQS
jgi:hypothetical protein